MKFAGDFTCAAQAGKLVELDPTEIAMTHPEFDPEYVFTHHATTQEKLARYDAIHAAAKTFAEVILNNTPHSHDQRAALQLVREATMMANAAIALDGRLK